MTLSQTLSYPHSRGYLATPTRLLLAMVLFCVGMWAQPSSPPSAPAKPPAGAAPARTATAPEMTGADLEAFLDGLMPAQLERENIAGAVIAVVKDGQVFFAKGYGYSDMARRTPVTPDSTLFRPGSISKLFTWTSVMQLVEQGKLDLDRDVNDYLDFKIPPAFGKPITLRNIMTHTAGFEETSKDLWVADAHHLQTLEYYVKNHVPERIFPPGTVPAYSNYATTLAGYIVQRVSGKPFEQYVAENIFTPLEMKRSTFVQPLPEDLKPLMSNGYVLGSSDPKPFEFIDPFPAGGLSTTARDMCNFMIAHLQNGQFGSVQILRPETATLMHSRLFGADDRLNGMAHGFYEESTNGHRIIAHAGDTDLFHSDLHLILDSNVGFFVSYNSTGKGELNSRLVVFEKFLDRYFPYTQPPAGQIENAKADTAGIAGFYLISRRFDSSFLKLTSLLGQEKVFANSDGTISIDPSFLTEPNGERLKFEEIGPLFYREVHGRYHVGFKRDGNGRLQFQLDWPVFIFQRVGFWENKYFNYGNLIFSLGVMILTLVLWPVGALVRKHYGRPLNLSPLERKLRLGVRLVCIIFACFFGGWLAVLARAAVPVEANALAHWIVFLGILGVLCTCGAALACVSAFRSWSVPNRWIWTKLHDTALALACLGLVWFAITWNLMNFNIHY